MSLPMGVLNAGSFSISMGDQSSNVSASNNSAGQETRETLPPPDYGEATKHVKNKKVGFCRISFSRLVNTVKLINTLY